MKHIFTPSISVLYRIKLYHLFSCIRKIKKKIFKYNFNLKNIILQLFNFFDAIVGLIFKLEAEKFYH